MAEIVQARFTKGRSRDKLEKQPITAKNCINPKQQSPTIDLSQNLNGHRLSQNFRLERHVLGVDDQTEDDKA